MPMKMPQAIASVFERGLRFEGQSPKRGLLFANVALGAVLAAYLLIAAFPQIVFAHAVSHGPFQVHSTAPIDTRIYPLLDLAERKLRASAIDDPKVTYRVYLCPNHATFAFFAPTASAAFATNSHVTHNIFIAPSDVRADTVRSAAHEHNRRTLSGVIAHECTHSLLANHLGELRSLTLPAWKAEGYCDYVAGETSFNPVEGQRLLAAKQDAPSPSFFYYRAFAAVTDLLEKRHWSVAQLMDTPLTVNDALPNTATNAVPAARR